MVHAKIYSLPNCPNCRATVNKFNRDNIPFEEYSLATPDMAYKREELKSQGVRTAPFVELFNGEKLVKSWSGIMPKELSFA